MYCDLMYSESLFVFGKKVRFNILQLFFRLFQDHWRLKIICVDQKQDKWLPEKKDGGPEGSSR
jgi:hypothetical protein